MFMIGTSSPERTHTVVVLDDVGRTIPERTVVGPVGWVGRWLQSIVPAGGLPAACPGGWKQDLLATGPPGGAGADPADGWGRARGPGSPG